MRREGLFIGVLLAVCVLAAHGADPAPGKPRAKNAAPDLEFLEYLGTLESDEANWTDVVKADLMRASKPKGTTNKDQAKTEGATKSAGSEK